jgi:hypothetical protein
MKQILRTVSVYAIAYVALLVIVLGLLYAYPKVELHMLLNGGHTAFLDTFFKYYSVLAEWPLYVLALLPLLWRKWEITLFYAICELAAGAVVQILKHLFNEHSVQNIDISSLLDNSGADGVPGGKILLSHRP